MGSRGASAAVNAPQGHDRRERRRRRAGSGTARRRDGRGQLGVTTHGAADAATAATELADESAPGRSPDGDRRGRRPRLRRAVLAAHRAPRARVRRVLASCCRTTSAIEEVRRRKPKGLILRGGPASVYAEGAPKLDKELLELGIPVLGICYGMQLLALNLGGKVEGAEVGEFGRSELHVREHGRLLAGPARRADLLDVAPRHRLRGAARVHRAGLVDRVAGRRVRVRRARDLRHPVPPRGRPHALRARTCSSASSATSAGAT